MDICSSLLPHPVCTRKKNKPNIETTPQQQYGTAKNFLAKILDNLFPECIKYERKRDLETLFLFCFCVLVFQQIQKQE